MLETSLSAWLPRQRWFGAKTHKIQFARVINWVELPAPVAAHNNVSAAAEHPGGGSIPPALFYFEIGYGDNHCDVYQIPLAFSTGTGADDLTASHPQSIIAMLPSPAGSGVLHDATVREDLRQGLFTLIERNASLAVSSIGTTALEAGESVPAARTEQSDNEAVGGREAAELLESPEWAGQHQEATGEGDSAPREVTGIPVAPAPISAQPGEAATPPRSATPASSAQRKQLRESPSAGDPVPASGRLDARASAAFAGAHGNLRLPARVGSAEQSNTSILYGNQFILKLFRRLQSGENPDVEIGRFLTEVAHFLRIAPFFGDMSVNPIQGERTTVAMLQGLVANQGDGWQWFLDQLSGYFSSVASLPAPPETPPPGFTVAHKAPAEAIRHCASALDAAALLGRRTAEMHLAFAIPTDDPAFAPEPFTVEDLSRDARRIDAQIATTLDALRAKMPFLPDTIADDAALLLSRRRQLIMRAHAIETGSASGKRIRIHGDYHLGQTLRTVSAADGTSSGAGDFVLLDFEGEPARPLAERRQKQCPLKDVAGMVRSFSYAAYSGLNQFLSSHADAGSDTDRLTAWARHWQNAASAEFVNAYRTAMAANSDLFPQPDQAQALFAAYLLEKALYELLYELNNRPAWLRIPIGGILSM